MILDKGPLLPAVSITTITNRWWPLLLYDFSWQLPLMNLSAALEGEAVDLVLFPVTNSATTLEIPVSSDSWPPPSESSCFVRKIYRLKITWGMKTYSIVVNIHTHTCDLYNISKVFAFSIIFKCSNIIETVKTFLCFGEDYLSLFQLLLCKFFTSPLSLKVIFQFKKIHPMHD